MEAMKKTAQQRLADLLRSIPETVKPTAYAHLGSYLEGYLAGAKSASVSRQA